MSHIYYKQCRLLRGNELLTTWLPEEFASVGKSLRLKNARTWEGGWTVVRVDGPRLSEEYISEHSRDFLHQREASDI